MKKTIIQILVTLFFLHSIQIAAQSLDDSIQISTPKGSTFMAYEPVELWDDEDKDYWSDYFALNYPNADEVGDSTSTWTYNCHGYAWHMTEGGSTVWIGWHTTSEEDVYWTDQSYIETTEANASKISYYNGDHSAVQTSTQGEYISKWGDKVLMEHARDYGPSGYNMSNRKYYRLNLDITGSEALLCSGSQRTFNSNRSITGSTYSWVKDNNLTYVSGNNTASYRVQGAGADSAYIYLTMTTPSGEVATSSTKEFWVGTPVIEDREVDGNDYYSGYPVCPGDHYLGVTPVGDGAGTATWTVPSGITYFVGTNTLDFTFPSSSYGLGFSARSANSCGTGSSYSFYITKKTYGCSKSLSIILYPNPASDYITVSIVDQAEESMESDTNGGELNNYTIKIYNNQSYLVSTLKRSGKSFEIPIQDLKKGIYIIEVSDGINSCSEQLIVNNK